MDDDGLTSEGTVNPYDKASRISKVFFSWALVPLWKSCKGVDVIKEYNIKVPSKLSAGCLGEKLQRKLEERHLSPKKTKLFWILCRMFCLESFYASFLLFMKVAVLNLCQAYLMRLLLLSFQLTGSEDWFFFQRYGTAILFMVSIVIGVAFNGNGYANSEIVAIKIRVACTSVVYEKLLKICLAEMKRINVGQVVNIFASDVSKLELAAKLLAQRLTDCFQVAAFLVFMYLVNGLSTLIAFLVVLFIGASSLIFNRIFKRIGKEKAHLVDERLNLTKEMISEARTMKLLCWEEIYCNSIAQVRKKELKLCLYNCCYKALYGILSYVVSPLAMYIILNVMNLMGDRSYSPAAIYPCLVIINLIQATVIKWLSRTVDAAAYAWVSVKRIDEIVTVSENVEINNNNNEPKGSLSFNDLICSWEPTIDSQKICQPFMLKLGNLSFPSSEVTMVTGLVGGGKSTLLLTLANELHVHNGEVMMGGSFTYLPQEPWLFPATIRQNILFGLPYDEICYHKILNHCALLQDLTQLPNGDFTKVDDKGLTLSGGQKARIALARALYRQSDIYLLDDPLSAVDIKVGRHIWQHCFQNTTKTTIMVSHNLNFLKETSFTVFISDGSAICGKYAEMKNHLQAHINKDSVDGIMESSQAEDVKFQTEIIPKEIVNELPEIVKNRNKLLLYCKMACDKWNGFAVLLVIFFLSLMMQIANFLFNISFISYFSSMSLDVPQTSSLSTLGYLLLLEIVLRIIHAMIFFYLCIRASKQLHKEVLSSVMGTSMTFFDTHFTGDIINQFSKDIESLDDMLPILLFESVGLTSQVSGGLIIAGYSNPIVVGPIVMAILIFFVITKIYMKATVTLKAKEANARSPIYTYMNCTVNGAPVIRSHGNQKRVTKEFYNRQDQHSVVYFTLKSIGHLVLLSMEYLGTASTILLIFLTVLFPNYSSESRLGMALAMTFFIGNLLAQTTQMYIDADHMLYSVTHLYEYIGLKPEEDSQIIALPLSNWPEKGMIEFKKVHLTYGSSSSKKVALHNLNFKIYPSEKIGIVGRTGAGKTSLIAALFRLAEVDGSICIDGIDIKTLSLQNYRRKLSIIPQNPVILSGSIRRNLDPRNEYKDEDLWNVLESVQLKDTILKMGKGLEDGMDQLSVGQKQLFCLARPLLHQNKIIILDEATSNVDNKTDHIIQQVIRTKFSTSTILVIAHRLQTVIDLDRIMVMDNGNIAEFDTVTNLLNKSDGIFKTMLTSIK